MPNDRGWHTINAGSKLTSRIRAIKTENVREKFTLINLNFEFDLKTNFVRKEVDRQRTTIDTLETQNGG